MILIDSSVHIRWLRERVDSRQLLSHWIHAKKVATCGLIRAEVLRGVINPRQHERVSELFDLFREIPTDAKLWQQVADLAWTLDRRGIILPVTDLVIACCALRYNIELIAVDKHFSKIPNLKVRASLPNRPL